MAEKELGVLVVLASEPGRERLGEALVQAGSTVYLAGNAAAALEIVRTKTPDLVIADLRLPGTSGGALLARVRSLRPGTWRFLEASSPDWEAAAGFLGEGIAHACFFRTADPSPIVAAISSFARFPPLSPSDEAPRRILLVEDSRRRRRRLAALLAPFGPVTAAEDGVTALQAARKDSPGLVITGLALDGVDGLDLIRILRSELGCTAPVIVWEEGSILRQPWAAGIGEEATRVVERTDDRVDALLDEVNNLTRQPAPPRRRR